MMNNRSFNNYYLDLYLTCKEFNCLPYEGGFLDQPAKTAEAFKLIKVTINQYQSNREGVKKHG